MWLLAAVLFLGAHAFGGGGGLGDRPPSRGEHRKSDETFGRVFMEGHNRSFPPPQMQQASEGGTTQATPREERHELGGRNDASSEGGPTRAPREERHELRGRTDTSSEGETTQAPGEERAKL